MTNINWNQSINFNRTVANQVQNLPQPQEQPQAQQQNTMLQNLLPNTMQQLSQTASQLAMLNQQQMVNMLKDLLNFPKNIEQLLSQLTTNSQSVSAQTVLVLLASNLNLNQLASLLNNNSKEAMTNLYQMLAKFNQVGMSLKEEQLMEISKLISFVAASSTSDVQSLKTTMLMYLPWLPLTDGEAFKLEIAKKGSDKNSFEDDSITILISTLNYGNLKADIYKTSQDGIRIEVASSETFPVKDFDSLMKQESKKYSININMDFVQKSVFNKQKNEAAKTQVSMHTSPGVNPFLLVISTAVIKNVHFIDEKENLRETRKEKLE